VDCDAAAPTKSPRATIIDSVGENDCCCCCDGTLGFGGDETDKIGNGGILNGESATVEDRCIGR
ncbi:unnamed protein product, partial [Didymodactylos carnosus]